VCDPSGYWAQGVKSLRENWKKKLQIPPLRYAPVGMTKGRAVTQWEAVMGMEGSSTVLNPPVFSLNGQCEAEIRRSHISRQMPQKAGSKLFKETTEALQQFL
jgi:hypothetical protein